MSSKVSRPSTSSMDDHFNHLGEPESYLRKRFRDQSPDDDWPEVGELSDGLSEDEDVPGCPLPSTPEDTELLEAEVCVSCMTFHHKFQNPYQSKTLKTSNHDGFR